MGKKQCEYIEFHWFRQETTSFTPHVAGRERESLTEKGREGQ